MNIEEIKAREQAATSWLKKVHGCLSATAWKEISESVSDISTLLAEVERLTEENEQDKKLIESYKNSNLEQATEAYELEQKNATLENDKINADMNLENLTAEVEGLNTINATLKKELAELKENQLDPLEMAKVSIALQKNATLKKDKEFCLNTAKCNAEFYDEAKEENATLKKALFNAINNHCPCKNDVSKCIDQKLDCMDCFIQQAQAQLTHETQEAKK